MRSPCCPRLLCLALVLAVSASSVAIAADPQPHRKLDLKYVPEAAVGAVFVFPQQLKAKPELEMLPYEIITAGGKRDLGFDPLDVEQALLIVAPSPGPVPVTWGVSLRFGEPQTLAGKLTANLTPAKFEGVEYLRAAREDEPSCCVIDGRHVLIAPEEMLRQMIVADGDESPLKELLAAEKGDADATAILAFAPIRPMVQAGLQAMPPLPTPLQGLTTIPEQLKSVKLQVTITELQEVKLTLTAEDEGAAKQLQQTLKGALAFAKQMLLIQAGSPVRPGGDPVEQASVRYANRMADSIEKKFQPIRKGDQLTISANTNYTSTATAVMVALLLPAVQQAREAARRTQARNNLKQIVLSMHNFYETHGNFPARANFADKKPLLSWRVHVLPFLDEQKLYGQFHLDEPWDSKHNKALIKKMPAVYRNPNMKPGDHKTNFLGISGEGMFFDGEEGTRFRDIHDGTSNTIMVVEADADQAVIWTKPDDLEFDPEKPMQGLGKFRAGGFYATFCDGSVRFISVNLGEKTIRAYMTIDGGESIP